MSYRTPAAALLSLTLAAGLGAAPSAHAAPTPASADTVAAAATSTGTLSGRIVVAKGERLPAFTSVEVLGVPDGSVSTVDWGNPRLLPDVNSDGTWRLDDVPPGRYVVKVFPFSSLWSIQYLSRTHAVGTGIRAEARQYDVAAGQRISGLDLKLVKAGTIAGRVHVPKGVDATQITVNAHQWQPDNAYAAGGTWEWVGYHTRKPVAADGTYVVPHLEPGRYRVRFTSPDPRAGTVWTGGAAGAQGARDVVVSAGRTLQLDAALPLGTPVPPRPPAKIDMVAKPQLKGVFRVRKTVRVTRGTWDPRGVTVTVRWQSRRGKGAAVKSVARGTTTKLKLTRTLKGRQVRAKVTVTAPGHAKRVVLTGWRRVR